MNTYPPKTLRPLNLSASLRTWGMVILLSLPLSPQVFAMGDSQIVVGQNLMTTLNCKYGPSDDCISTAINMPFDFPFYGQTYRTLYVDTNGFVTLRQPTHYNPGYTTANSTTINRNIPRASGTTPPAITPDNNPDAVIAPFWDDLDLNVSQGLIRYAALPADAIYPRRVIVQWADAGFWKVAKPMGTFQVILYENGSIQFQYPNIMPGKPGQTRNKGGKASIGIENETGTCGVKYSYLGKDALNVATFVQTGQAIRFDAASNPVGCNAYTMNPNAAYENILLSDTPPTPLPATPNLSTGALPAHCATGISPNSVTFDWANSIDATQYRLLVSTDPNLKTTPNPLTIDASLITSDYIATNLQSNTTYYWTVVALNSVGGSAWANETLSFTTGGAVNPLPTKPQLTTPLNQAVSLTTPMTLTWQAAANATSYKLSISTDPDLNHLVTPIVQENTLVGTSYTATTLQPNTTYYWSVAAVNTAGETWATENFSFTTLNPFPAEPLLSTPADQAIGTTLPVTLTWQAAANATSYKLWVSTTPDVNHLATSIVQENALTGMSYSIAAGALQSNTTYYWAVAAINASGTTWASQNFSFTTATSSTGSGSTGGGSTGSGSTGSGSTGGGSTGGSHGWAGYSVILRKAGNGTGRIVAQSCPIGSYNPVTLYTALPDKGSRFVRWEGNIHSVDCYSSRATVAVTVNAIKTCTAVFETVIDVETTSITTLPTYDLYPSCMNVYRGVVAAYYLPGAENAGQARVHITNHQNVAVEVRGSLYHQTGYLLGKYNTVLVETLAPHTTLTFSMAELATQVGSSMWEGLAWLHITTPDGITVSNTLRNENKILENMNLTSDDGAYNLPSRNHPDIQAYIAIVNITNEQLDVYGSLYQKDGQLLGRANAAIAYNIPARGIRIISMEMLEYMAGTTTWQGRAKLQLTAPVTGIKVFNLSLHKEGTLTNMSAVHGNQVDSLSYGLDSFVRITNVTDKSTEVSGELFDQQGNSLQSQQLLVQLAPHETVVFNTVDLANKLGIAAWKAEIRLVTTATTAIKLMSTSRKDGILINTIDRIPESPAENAP